MTDRWPTENAGEAFGPLWKEIGGGFSGYSVTLEVAGKIIAAQFVTPAILGEAINAIASLDSQDPQDEFIIRVKWVQLSGRPAYTQEQPLTSGE